MDGLLKEHERVAKRQRVAAARTVEGLDRLVGELRQCKGRIQSAAADGPVPMELCEGEAAPRTPAAGVVAAVDATARATRDLVGKIPGEHRDLYGAISKFGKAVDKAFPGDLERIVSPDAFQDSKATLNEVVAKHLLRQGHFGIAESFVREAGLDLETTKMGPFVEMYNIMEAIRAFDLRPALDWAAAHREELAARDSALEFKLHRLQYLRHLALGERDSAIAYARQHFAPFSNLHMKDIQRLMGCLLFYKRLDKSPYADLHDPIHWTDIASVFTRDCCSLLGLSFESPLFVCVTAGCMAVPTLLKMAAVLQAKGSSAPLWSSKDELPAEIDLGRDFQFHSIFACPVSREQSSDENPPVLLPCGHCICRVSLQKLSKGSRFKCPYCPCEQTPSQSKPIFF